MESRWIKAQAICSSTSPFASQSWASSPPQADHGGRLEATGPMKSAKYKSLGLKITGELSQTKSYWCPESFLVLNIFQAPTFPNLSPIQTPSPILHVSLALIDLRSTLRLLGGTLRRRAGSLGLLGRGHEFGHLGLHVQRQVAQVLLLQNILEKKTTLENVWRRSAGDFVLGSWWEVDLWEFWPSEGVEYWNKPQSTVTNNYTCESCRQRNGWNKIKQTLRRTPLKRMEIKQPPFLTS